MFVFRCFVLIFLLLVFCAFDISYVFCDALFARVIFSEVLAGFIGGFGIFPLLGRCFLDFQSIFAPFVSIYTLQILTLFF